MTSVVALLSLLGAARAEDTQGSELLRTRRASEIAALQPGGAFYEAHVVVGTPQDAARMQPGGSASIEVTATTWTAVINGQTLTSKDGGVTWTAVAGAPQRPASPTSTVAPPTDHRDGARPEVAGSADGASEATRAEPPSDKELRKARRDEVIETKRGNSYFEFGWVPPTGARLGVAIQPWSLGRRRLVFGAELAGWSSGDPDEPNGAISGFVGYQLWLLPWLTPYVRGHVESNNTSDRGVGAKAEVGVNLYAGRALTLFANADVIGAGVLPRAGVGIGLDLMAVGAWASSD